MSIFSAYLDRQQPLEVTELLPLSENRSKLFVSIPCFDEPDLPKALESLATCTPPVSDVTVIVAVNSSDKTSPQQLFNNLKTIQSVQEWLQRGAKPFYQLRLLHAPALPSKWAGVGWARKIAMDEAIRCLDRSGLEEGILIGFDADSRVSANYFTSIETAFKENPRANFVTLNFNHPIDDPALTTSLREGIIQYELYLRYHRNAMNWCGYPHAIHTIGSSFAVRASSYVKQGGMNRRQAGEDFHFLYKMVLLGEYGVVKDATVYPAARISNRVPFGTGAALKKWDEGSKELYSAYSLKTFETLIPLFSSPGLIFDTGHTLWKEQFKTFDPVLKCYIEQTETLARLEELKKNCADVQVFTRRFYHLINAFWIIQYLNLCESMNDGKGILVEEANGLLIKLGVSTFGNLSALDLLEFYRRLDFNN
ncbi:MAG: hypothetical protein M0Q53_18305 [Prolixibacteraceae bacterium]|jgi:hypothetical protein|nr:hypothetical protein [Prolixibacteraceae bacterium]